MKTIDYYNNHAQEFFDRTAYTDLSEICDEFLKHLPVGSSILDAGCGSGRDSKYFLERGYRVSAFDASHEMVRMASELTGLQVHQMLFQDMAYEDKFDAVWANASLLHIPFDEHHAIYERIHKALKSGGLFYCSYKYGNGPMPTPEREFYLMNETTILPYFGQLFEPIKIWKTADTRSQRNPSPDNAWLNCISRKVS